MKDSSPTSANKRVFDVPYHASCVLLQFDGSYHSYDNDHTCRQMCICICFGSQHQKVEKSEVLTKSKLRRPGCRSSPLGRRAIACCSPIGSSTGVPSNSKPNRTCEKRKRRGNAASDVGHGDRQTCTVIGDRYEEEAFCSMDPKKL